MRRPRFPLIALIVLLAPALAFAQGHGGGCHCGSWTTTPIPWSIEHPPGPFFDAAASEFDNWNNVASLFTYAAGDQVMGAENGANEIGFLDVQQVIAEYGVDIDEFTFGFAPSWPESAFGNFNECPRPVGEACNGTYDEADVIMNADFISGWTTGRPPDFDDQNGPALYEATALHELGHTFGLHHNFNNLSTMNYYHDFAAHYLAISDAAATRAAYPSGVKSMTDLATYPFRFDPNRTSYEAVAAVTVSPTLVNAGGSLTVSNVTVENVGTADLSNVIIQFYLSVDSTIGAGDILLGQGTFTGTFFASGFWDTGSGPVTVKVPASTASGTYYFGARVVHSTSQTDPITYNNTWVGPTRVTVAGSTGGGPCKPSTTDLCLGSNRFKVTLAAVNPRDGRTGAGFSIPYNDQNGFFAIPELTNDTTNFEVFVKILDARVIDGKFWVFYGGLTDFEYTITIVDTETGAQKQYTKPGLVFTGGADTSAF